MAAVGQRIMDGTGQREHLATLFGSQPRRDQRAGLQPGFDHQGAQCEAGNDPVAPWKMIRARRRARREFADQRAVRRDPLGQRVMLARVDPIRAGADHRHRRGARLQRCHVGGAVDAVGHAAGDDKTGLRERPGKRAGMRQPGPAGAARTHDGHLRVQQQAGVAQNEQGRWRLRDVFQLRRKIRLGATQQPMLRLRQPRQVGVQPDGGRLLQPAARRFAEPAGLPAQLRQHRLDVATGHIQPLAQTARTEARRAQGDQPRAQFIHVVHGPKCTECAQTTTARWWPRRAVGIDRRRITPACAAGCRCALAAGCPSPARN